MGYLFSTTILRGHLISRGQRHTDPIDAGTYDEQFPPFHVLPENDGWLVRQERDPVPCGNFATQAEAIRTARRLALAAKCRLVIHDENGAVR